MNKKEIIDKIKKCMALSSSSNEHEAEIALRQARALMEKYGIEDADVMAADASEQHAKAGAGRTPSNWETILANKISSAFGCTLVFKSSYYTAGSWTFIGCGASPEIATYAFQVLLRQCKRQRAEHIKAKLKRCKTSTKTRRADLFCQGWVQAVAGKISAFSGSDNQATAIDAYMKKNYPTLRNIEGRNRNEGRNLRGYEYDDFIMGKQSGRNAELNRGVGGDQQLALE